jgi:hypothetical protein
MLLHGGVPLDHLNEWFNVCAAVGRGIERAPESWGAAVRPGSIRPTQLQARST